MKWGKSGFSLVEVIIAMAVLALLTVPILAYFTQAATTATSGRDTQRATQAAESVAEELNGYTDFSQLEALDGVEDWTIVGTAATPAPSAMPVSMEMKMEKTLTVDGRDFLARVQVDYDYGDPAASATPAAQFNSYAEPQLQEVYSESNVVAVETDQSETAVSDFYYQLRSRGKTNSKAEVKEAMSRKMLMNISENGDIYDVEVSYEYACSLDGADENYTTSVVSTKIEKDKFENLYLFYNLLDCTAEDQKYHQELEVSTNAMSDADAAKLKVYLVSQGTTAEDKSKIKIKVSSSGGAVYNSILYCANDSNFEAGVSRTENSIVEKKTSGKRIAAITVDVYDPAMGDDEVLAHIQTSKGE